MADKNDYMLEVWNMTFPEVTAHIREADILANTAKSELEAAEKALRIAQENWHHTNKYARLTRDFTAKALKASSDEKEEKVRENYRAKFGALKASLVAAESKRNSAPKQLKTSNKKEDSITAIEKGMEKLESLVQTVKDATPTQNKPTEPDVQEA